MTIFMVIASLIYAYSIFAMLITWKKIPEKISQILSTIAFGLTTGACLLICIIEIPLEEIIWYPKGANLLQEYIYVLVAFLIYYVFGLKPELDDISRHNKEHGL